MEIPCREPSFLSSELAGGLCRTGGHEYECSNSENKSQQALNHEKPPPTSIVMDAAEVKKTVRKESRKYVSERHCCPEETQPKRELVMFVEVR